MGISTGEESTSQHDDQLGNGIGETPRREESTAAEEQPHDRVQPADNRPVSDLDEMLGSLAPVLRPGQFVFTTITADSYALLQSADATVLEDEGISAVLSKDLADEAGLGYEYEAAWITLRVNSALAAVGLTAAVSSALAAQGVSCNVIAGRHHDHVLVEWQQRDTAMSALEDLTQNHRADGDTARVIQEQAAAE